MEFLFQSKAAGEKARLLAAFEQFVQKNRVPAELSKAADLAIEEHLTNILSYGFADANDHTVCLRFEFRSGELEIEMSDDGKPFNPLEYPVPDLKAPAEKRSIGGLGIHMMRQSMDSVGYQRASGRNILLMRKRVKG